MRLQKSVLCVVYLVMEFNLFMNIMSQLEDRYLKNREALDASVLRKNVLGRLRKFNLINSALRYEKALVPLNTEF